MKRVNRLSLITLMGSVCISAWGVFALGAEEVQVTHPYPGGVKADLWLVAGQSNMGGYATVKKETVPDPKIMFFSAAKDEDVWVVAKDPQERLMYPHGDAHGMVPDFTRLPVGGSGLVIPFAQHLRKYIDNHIGFIGTTTGQSMARVWDPELKDQKEKQLPNYLYGRMIDRVKRAGGYGNLKGMIWYQGESDAIEFTKDLVHYKRILYNFIDGVRRDTGNPDLPIMIVQISRFARIGFRDFLHSVSRKSRWKMVLRPIRVTGKPCVKFSVKPHGTKKMFTWSAPLTFIRWSTPFILNMRPFSDLGQGLRRLL